MTIYSIFNNLTSTDPLTHPPIHPTTHPYTYAKVGVSPQIINLQTEFNYLDQMTIYSIFNNVDSKGPWGHALSVICSYTRFLGFQVQLDVTTANRSCNKPLELI